MSDGVIDMLKAQEISKRPERRVYVAAITRQGEVKRALARLSKSGHHPSVREIGAEVGLKSSASVSRYLKMLVESGEVEQTAFGHYIIKT